VVGPTGAGKSALALWLANLLHGEIVNCDSVQVYRGLDIGSAKTPPGERMGIAHHLLDVLSPEVELTAGEYARMASLVLEEIRSRGVLPVIAGGTGFYLRALLSGLSPAPPRNPALRERLFALAAARPAALHRFLRRYDPSAAARIHPNDLQKLIRAIELAGKSPGPRRQLTGFRVLKLGLNPPRTLLYERINRRTAWMLENGLLEETQRLLANGLPLSAKVLRTLGYRQALEVLTQGVALPDAIADCQRSTRHYAKRQMTWFRAEANMHWLAGFGEEAQIREQAAALVRAFLQGATNAPDEPGFR
jgi:tRNA dimethylallyltransferase